MACPTASLDRLRCLSGRHRPTATICAQVVPLAEGGGGAPRQLCLLRLLILPHPSELRLYRWPLPRTERSIRPQLPSPTGAHVEWHASFGRFGVATHQAIVSALSLQERRLTRRTPTNTTEPATASATAPPTLTRTHRETIGSGTTVASAEGASSTPLSPRFGIATESVSGSGLAPALDSVAVFTLVTSSPDLAPGTVEESGSVAASDPGAVFSLVTSPPDLAGDTVEESGSVAVSDPGAVFSAEELDRESATGFEPESPVSTDDW